jgi:DNA mismatch repair protein MutS2
VVNASVEFDLETLQPTYHLTVGLPGRSNALAIAERLGLPGELVSGARAELNPTDLQAEDLLDEIHRQREQSRQARSQAEAARQEAEDLRVELVERLENIEDERREVLASAQREAEAEVEKLQDEIRQVRRELTRARLPLEALKPVEEQVEALEDQVDKPVERKRADPQDQILQRPVRLGDKVRLRSLNTQGVVTSLGESEAEVQVGVLRIRARLSELGPIGTTESETESKPTASAISKQGKPASQDTFYHASPGMELDLRGKRGDEALDVLDRYLDSAYLAGLPFVRIIHGKGTGKLRILVRQALGAHPHVASFEGGGDKEGGEGVTVAKLRTN